MRLAMIAKACVPRESLQGHGNATASPRLFPAQVNAIFTTKKNRAFLQIERILTFIRPARLFANVRKL